MLRYPELVTALKQLKLQDKPVIVHSSLKPFGMIERGAETVLDALLETTNGLLVPTFTYFTMVTPEVGPPNNGITYGNDRDLNKLAINFDLQLRPDKMMGIFPYIVLQQEEASRTAHPILSFGGINADYALAAQTLYDPLAPIAAFAEQDGWVILINVDHSVNTSIHYAEKLAGRKQFTRWAIDDGRIVECPGFPGDSTGFNVIAPLLDSITRHVIVGDGFIQAVPLNHLCAIVQDLIKKDPLALLCQRSDCERCNAVRACV